MSVPSAAAAPLSVEEALALDARSRRPGDAIALDRVKRVLVVMLRHHGDVLLTSPVYRALKEARPDIEIDAVIYRDTLPMLAFNPDLARIHCIDRRWKKQGPWGHARAEWAFFRTLRARHYDLLIHLTDHRRGMWLARGLSPRIAVAPRARTDTGLAARLWNGAFTHRYANASSVGAGSGLARRHTVDQNLDAVRRLGIPIARAPSLTMVAGADGERDADALLSRLRVGGDFIAMQPTSRWMFKCWPVESNAALIGQLLRRGETVVLSCAPDARERAMLAAIVACVSALHDVPLARLHVADDDGTLNRLAAVIGRAKLYVGIDSAPMHIAAAMGTPVVALFGPSGECNWGPWQVAHRVVASDVHACRPCGQDGCGNSKVSDCLVRLPVPRALAAIDALLAETSAHRDPLRFA